MNRGEDGRFRKGRSGNPKGRPPKPQPNGSAFDVIFDKTLTVTQDGVERELTVDEALQLQTYQDALKGKTMAVRKVLKMIEKREQALAQLHGAPKPGVKVEWEHETGNANEAMRILGIAVEAPRSAGSPGYGSLKLATWATQAALSRPGRRRIDPDKVEIIEQSTVEPDRLRWPRGMRHE